MLKRPEGNSSDCSSNLRIVSAEDVDASSVKAVRLVVPTSDEDSCFIYSMANAEPLSPQTIATGNSKSGHNEEQNVFSSSSLPFQTPPSESARLSVFPSHVPCCLV